MIRVFTDTTASLTLDEYRQFDIHPIPIILNQGETSKEELFEISYEEFYREQRAGKRFTTSQPSPETYIKLFTPYLEAGDEVVAIIMSGGISSSVNTAEMVVEMMNAKGKIAIIDSKTSGFVQGYMARKAKELADQGCKLDELTQHINGMHSKLHTYFIVESLRYLYEGGRLSGAQALIGSVIQIKPIVWFDPTGKLTSFEKIRTLKAARNRTIELVKELAPRTIEQFSVQYNDNLDEAKEFAAELSQCITIPITFTKLSPVLGCHTGPELLGVGIVTKE